MADAPTQKQEAPKQQEGSKGLARIPVSRFWLRGDDTIDLPGGNALANSFICGPQSAPGRAYSIAHFVPAHQVIELEWYRNEQAEPVRRRIPIAMVKQFE